MTEVNATMVHVHVLCGKKLTYTARFLVNLFRIESLYIITGFISIH